MCTGPSSGSKVRPVCSWPRRGPATVACIRSPHRRTWYPARTEGGVLGVLPGIIGVVQRDNGGLARFDEATWEARRHEWLPSQADLDYVKSLMTPVYEPGKVANWLAAPFKGINGQPADFEYVRF